MDDKTVKRHEMGACMGPMEKSKSNESYVQPANQLGKGELDYPSYYPSFYYSYLVRWTHMCVFVRLSNQSYERKEDEKLLGDN